MRRADVAAEGVQRKSDIGALGEARSLREQRALW